MNRPSKTVWLFLRWVGAFLIGYAAFRYLGLIVVEGLDEEKRLTLVELGILLLAGGSIALLVRPDLLGLVKLIEVAGIKLELSTWTKLFALGFGRTPLTRGRSPLISNTC